MPSSGKSRNNLRRKSISSSSSSSTTTTNSSSTTFNQDSSTYSKDDHSDAIQYDYESRIAFIQKQHAKMLASLHQEMEQIELGQNVLERIEAELKEGKCKKKLVDMSSEFFSKIPTDFGDAKPVPITTMEMLHEKEELLKFYLRMGFEDMSSDNKVLTPISGVMDLPVPGTLWEAAKMVTNRTEVDNSVRSGSEFESRQAGGPVKYMNNQLYAAILLYTSNAIYADLNRSLREENRKKVIRYFSYVRLFFEAFDHLPKQKADLWRGISCCLYDQYQVGKVITWWGVSSCTSNQQVARNFMKSCGGNTTFLTIKAKTACDISNLSFFSNEKESLLAPGTQLKVLKSKKVGKVAEIELEEVGRAFD